MASSALAVASLAYMARLVALDWQAGEDLASPAAHAYASRLCARVPGCERASIGSGFDWRGARRLVLYRVQVGIHTHFDPRASLEVIRVLATREPAHRFGSRLAWALRAEPVLVTHFGETHPAKRKRAALKAKSE